MIIATELMSNMYFQPGTYDGDVTTTVRSKQGSLPWKQIGGNQIILIKKLGKCHLPKALFTTKIMDMKVSILVQVYSSTKYTDKTLVFELID